MEMLSLIVWYYATHPELESPSPLSGLVEEFSYVATLKRGEQLAQRAPVQEELRRRATNPLDTLKAEKHE
jgi:hypothetical protein